ncbi:MAG: lipoate--protein ligase family protein [Thermaerobacter sp.]|nr:lipoate--protein ligase family protein [Thermaerobacter sp.]
MLPDARFVHLSQYAPLEHLRLSPVLAETVARWSADRQSSAVVIRHQKPYILLGPKDRRLPKLDSAVAWLNELGYPVFMRIGGGSAVLLDEDCLSFAVSQPCRDFTVWEANFRSMAQGVIDGLRNIDIDAGFGRAVGSYCEGPYDLVANGRKIAGIAQAIRGGFALVSGMLLIRQDPQKTTQLLQQFYIRAGSDLVLDPEAVTALMRLPGMHDLTVEAVESALKQGFAGHYRLKQEPLSEEEIQLAQQLMQERELHVAAPIEREGGR